MGDAGVGEGRNVTLCDWCNGEATSERVLWGRDHGPDAGAVHVRACKAHAQLLPTATGAKLPRRAQRRSELENPDSLFDPQPFTVRRRREHDVREE